MLYCPPLTLLYWCSTALCWLCCLLDSLRGFCTDPPLTPLCLSCTVIHSRVLCSQTRQLQIHHAVRIVSCDFYPSFNTFCIYSSTSITSYNAYPFKCSSFRLTYPGHVVATKGKARSLTGEAERFCRLFQDWTGGNGLQTLTIQP